MLVVTVLLILVLCCPQALQIHLQPDDGDILIFMPGQEDIEVTCEVRLFLQPKYIFHVSLNNTKY